MNRQIPKRIVCVFALVCILLSCGLSGEPPQAMAATGGDEGSKFPILPAPTVPLPPYPEDMEDEIEPKAELYPADVQTVTMDGARHIIKTYILTEGQSPADISRDTFIRDGWLYILSDITETRTSGTDTRSHTETVELETANNNLNDILKLLAPTLEYQSSDGLSGILTLDMSSVKCEAAGHRNSSYTVTATREYPHLSTNDISLIPKTITDNGRTLTLDSVSWEAQQTVNVDYTDIPSSYRAIAKYTGTASSRTVTGYITTADYTGEIARTITGDTVYTVYFLGGEINPAPEPSPTPEPAQTPTPTPAPSDTPAPVIQGGGLPVVPFLIGLAIIAALLTGAWAYWFMLRHNVKVSRVKDGRRTLVAKDKISMKNLTINLTPLDYVCFDIEIDKHAAKAVNGRIITVRQGNTDLNHKIAYEGNVYTLEVDFEAGTIQAVY
jgi:hypothetical protein